MSDNPGGGRRRATVVAGSGHLSNQERPGLFNTAVRAFLRSVAETND